MASTQSFPGREFDLAEIDPETGFVLNWQENLRDYLDRHHRPTESLTIDTLSSGESNQTFLLRRAEEKLILRAPPADEVEARELLHDIMLEYRVLEALATTDVPVPQVILHCSDQAVIGKPFYVMSHEPGPVVAAEEPEDMELGSQRRSLGDSLIQTLGRIHRVGNEGLNLERLDLPEERGALRLERWSRYRRLAEEKTREERTVEELDEIESWLTQNVPDSEMAVLNHGDFRLENMALSFRGETVSVGAVLDWELCSLSSPFSDLAWLLAFWRDPADPESSMPEVTPMFTREPGYPTREELIELYESKTGWSYQHRTYHRVFAFYKLTLILEMYFGRFLQGKAKNPFYPVLGERVPLIARRALKIIDGRWDGPL